MTNTPTDAGAQGVTPEMVLRFALECIDGRIGLTENSLFAWSKSDRPEARERILGIEREAGRQRTMRAALVAALAGGGWVSVKERMPEPHLEVCIAIRHEKRTRQAFWSERSKCWRFDVEDCTVNGDANIDNEVHGEVTHWRPMPNPPAMDATREGA